MNTKKASGRRLQSEPAMFEVVVQGWVSARWAQWFGAPQPLEAGEQTRLSLLVPDQAALLGHLQKLTDLGYPLLLVRRANGDAPEKGEPADE